MGAFNLIVDGRRKKLLKVLFESQRKRVDECKESVSMKHNQIKQSKKVRTSLYLHEVSQLWMKCDIFVSQEWDKFLIKYRKERIETENGNAPTLPEEEKDHGSIKTDDLNRENNSILILNNSNGNNLSRIQGNEHLKVPLVI